MQHTTSYTSGYTLDSPYFSQVVDGVMGVYSNNVLEQSWNPTQKYTQIMYTTLSTSTSTGSLLVSGGVGISNNLSIGNSILYPILPDNQWYLISSPTTTQNTNIIAMSPTENLAQLINVSGSFSTKIDKYDVSNTPVWQVYPAATGSQTINVNDFVDSHTTSPNNTLTTGQYLWQSFMATSTGYLTEIDFMARGSGSPCTCTARLYSGGGIAGTLLREWTVSNIPTTGFARGTSYAYYNTIFIAPTQPPLLITNAQQYTLYMSVTSGTMYFVTLSGWYGSGSLNINGVDQGTADCGIYVLSASLSGYYIYCKGNANTILQNINTQPSMTITASGSGTYPTGPYSGGIVYDSSIVTSYTTSDTIRITNTTESTSTSVGTLVISGGTGIMKNLYIGGNEYITSTTASTSTSTGSLLVTGGAGIGGNLNVGGSFSVAGTLSYTTLSLSGTTDSTSVTNGTLVVAGGVGVAKQLCIGGDIYTNGSMTINNPNGIYINGSATSFTSALQITNTSGSYPAYQMIEGGSANATSGVGPGVLGIYDSATGMAGFAIKASTAQILDNYTTQSTSTSTGALLVSGGVGVAKRLVVGDTVSTQILEIGNASTNGIKINTTSTGVSAFGWKDLIGEISIKSGGGNPVWTLLTTNVGAYGFVANNACDLMFHIPHDYAAGTDMYLHVHWTHNNTAISGFIRWNAYVIYAKGFNQQAFNTSEIVIPIGQDTTNIKSIPQYQHMVTESQLSAANGLISSAVNVSISASSTTLTSASSLFSQWEVGRTIRIIGAGAAGANLDTTITAWTSATQVTVGNAASTTITSQPNYQLRVLDTNSIEVDGMMATNVKLLTRPTMTGGTNLIYIFTADVHYQSTNMTTKNKAPNFYT